MNFLLENFVIFSSPTGSATLTQAIVQLGYVASEHNIQTERSMQSGPQTASVQAVNSRQQMALHLA
ncbi:hypothetical protein [Pseudomonas mucidolens]|uniref:hypothetical protein n=1 Tax=Pseudomonas mucidolens TaxID=46679 RepID=UPI000A05689A|nr:hypothetical protein [Pseudomonas mucidolens]